MQWRVVIDILSFVAWFTSMTWTIATKLGCCSFKTECTDAMDAMYWYMFSLLFTFTEDVINCVYVNTRQNGHFDIILCVFLHSRAVRRAFCVCMLQCLRSENRTELSSFSRCQISYSHILTFLTFYTPCSKCILAYVPPAGSYVCI